MRSAVGIASRRYRGLLLHRRLHPLSPLALRDSAPLPVYRHAPDLSPDMEVDVGGWWCVRYGDALARVEASTPADAVQRSLGLVPLPPMCLEAYRADRPRARSARFAAEPPFVLRRVDACLPVRLSARDVVDARALAADASLDASIAGIGAMPRRYRTRPTPAPARCIGNKVSCGQTVFASDRAPAKSAESGGDRLETCAPNRCGSGVANQVGTRWTAVFFRNVWC